jgi:hypothetical protein
VDIAGELLFSHGRARLAESTLAADLVEGDFYRLTDLFPGEKFDLVLSIQTLMGIPEYSVAVEQMLAVTRGWLVISSLFTDFPVDARIEVMDYGRPPDCQGPFFYNVYGVDRFRDFCMERGAEEMICQDFYIDIDLPPPQKYGMTTFTQRLEDGQRIQFSGPLHMPWKFVAIRMRQR